VNWLDTLAESAFCRILLTDNGMTMKIESFAVAQFTCCGDVFAIHRHLAQVVEQCRLLKYESVVFGNVKICRDRIGDTGDLEAVRMRILFERVDLRRKLEKFFVKSGPGPRRTQHNGREYSKMQTVQGENETWSLT